MYNTIVVDPPWPISMAGHFKTRPRPRNLPYRTMTMAEIEALNVCVNASPGAHIYLWCTNKTLRAAFGVMETWGVSFHQVLVTVKKSGMTPSLGYVFGAEFCLLGFAGRPMQKFNSIGALNWWVDNPRHGKHSTKPDEFYEKVMRMSPGPYLDMFARRQREGWDVWGDEVEGVEL